VRRMLRPTKTPTGAWRVQYRHPLAPTVPRNHNLGRDEAFAKAVCSCLTTFIATPYLCQPLDKVSPDQLAEVGFSVYAKKAAEVFYGPCDRLTEHFKLDRTLPNVDEALGVARAFNADLRAGHGKTFDEPERPISEADIEFVFAHFAPQKMKQLRDYTARLETDLQAARSDLLELADLREENKMLRRQLNANVKASIDDALRAFWPHFTANRSRRHVQQAQQWLGNFRDSLPEQGATRIADVRRSNVLNWLRSMQPKPRNQADGNAPVKTALHARTLHKRRNYVTRFFRFCTQQYDLVNPIAGLESVYGASKNPPQPAISRLADLMDLWKALEPHPYWHTLVLAYTLAGCREAELLHLKLDAVDFDAGVLSVYSYKKQTLRDTPIEKSTLLPVLKAHVDRRRAEQAASDNPALRSEYLFPSLVPPGPTQRRISVPFVWSGPNVLLDAWKRVSDTVKTDDRPVWSYGPLVWRRTCATAMSMSGVDVVQIGQWLDHTINTSFKHYIKSQATEKRWQFRWI
jgi:integrase